jgi:hypothetical protein
MATLCKESQIILAIEALRKDKNLSRRKAAAIYNVPEATLHYRMNGRTPKPESRPAAHRLTITEDEAVVRHVLDLDTRGFSPRLADIEDMANLLLLRRDGGRVGKHWAEKFVKRQPELKTAEFETFCKNNNIITISLPAHSSHLTQPAGRWMLQCLEEGVRSTN